MTTLNSKKLDSPYQAEKDKMNDLAFRIQSAAGLNPQEIFPRKQIPVIENRVSPVQLSVEFGVSNRSLEAPVCMEKNTDMVNEPVSLKTESTDYQTTVQDNVVEDKLNYEVKQLETIQKDATEVESSEITSTDLTGELDIPSPVIPEVKDETTKTEITPVVVESELAEDEEPKVISKVDTQHERPAKEENKIEQQTSFQFPWASILGLVATAVAVFGAYWVWNNIQKPASVEDVVQNVSNQTRLAEEKANIKPVVNTLQPEQLEFYELTEEHEVLNAVLSNNTENKIGYLDFVASEEPSKISMVELEKKGFIVLELEDHLFDPIRL
ncbi:MAG: hypothetical protein P8I77_07965 [Bacteroidia bacterium]|nr:hypothetical protein [Bacteroidia bacterium]